MPKKLNLEGENFGKWLVKAYLGSSSWRCVCECGEERSIKTCDLRSGSSKSCGCTYAGTCLSFKKLHGGTGTPEYRSWKHMKERCNNPNDKRFEHYGGRGISVCDRWLNDFSAFLEDMGKRPSPAHSIERVDVNGNYEPSNCVWASTKEQARNTQRTSFVQYNGERHKLVDLADTLGIKANTLHKRVRRGQMEAA